MRLDATGVPADQIPRDRVDVSLDRVGEEERLPKADETLVRVHEHLDEARELVEPERVDLRDLHGCSSR
jgi:hypothetical protein